MSTHRDHIAYVCATPWPEIRARVDALVARGGMAALLEAASVLAESEFRSTIPEADARPAQVTNSLKRAGHPLGWLHPRRIDAEQELGVLTIASDGTSYTEQPPPQGNVEQASSIPQRDQSRFDEGPTPNIDTVDLDPPGSLTAFDSIIANSNGEATSVVISFSAATEPHRGLINAVEGCFEPLRNRAIGEHVSARDAVSDVLWIAINGGAYDKGGGAAFGRLAAWRTLRWLITPDEHASMDEVVAMMDECSWVRFSTRTPWFRPHVFLGCHGCLSPDGRRFAAVAWKDTD